MSISQIWEDIEQDILKTSFGNPHPPYQRRFLILI